MKIPFVLAHVFWTPWWDVDHHLYACPIEIYVHTPRWFLGVRLFSDFAQGGDRRGTLAWHETREGPNPYERERVAKWVLSDEPPEIWEGVHGHWLNRQYCRWCLEPLTDPTRCPEGDHADIARRWHYRYWKARRRHPREHTSFCVWCLHDEETCRVCGGHNQPDRLYRPERYVRHGVFLRHLWQMHVLESHHCGIRIKDMEEIEVER